MGMVPRLLVSALAACLLGMAAPARAQIYVSRDAAGTLVLSDRPVDGAISSYAVRNSAVRTTRAVPAETGALYDEIIESAAATHGVRPELVRAVIQVESGFNPRARSHKGAMGLMQLMPATARELQVGNPYDPAANIEGGVRHLRQLLDRFDVRLAVAAYNAGAGAVQRFGGIPPFRETQAYVRQVLQLAGVS